MESYKLEIKQLVDYPKCRIYREFIQSIMNDTNYKTNGDSYLYYYVVLCSYANFRSSYRRIEGNSYIIGPGEWITTLREITSWFRCKLQSKSIKILDSLQKQHYIEFTQLGRGKIIKFKIKNWAKTNTILEYNAPCQKDKGFFFLSYNVAKELLQTGKKCSELDIVLDLWINAVYNDPQVDGSDLGPVVYIRNYTGNPFSSYSKLSRRWGISKSTTGRILNKFQDLGYLTLLSFPGRTGSIIYLNGYLSTMFSISDVMVDKEEVAMTLNIEFEKEVTDKNDNELKSTIKEDQIFIPRNDISVPKSILTYILRKISEILYEQGVPCLHCPHTHYKLYNYQTDCKGLYLFLKIECTLIKKEYKFEIRIKED